MKKFFFLAALAATLVSCDNIEISVPQPEEQKIPISISTTLTRATDSAFEAGDKVGIFVVNDFVHRFAIAEIVFALPACTAYRE